MQDFGVIVLNQSKLIDQPSENLRGFMVIDSYCFSPTVPGKRSWCTQQERFFQSASKNQGLVLNYL